MNIHDNLMIQRYKCFIFSDDVNQIENIFSNNPQIKCKIIELDTEIRFARNVLITNYGVNISRIDMLDKNKIFILSRNFDKIKNAQSEEVCTDPVVMENLKNDMLVLAVSTVIKLSVELPNTQNKTNAKFRNKTKQLNMLKNVLAKDNINML
ncbi:MAG: hypothetical protein IJ473_01510 [Alphaproteobacteria bacterium]|nr:hypothetical protein [Alphaproteobacteria bacterium]MBQ8660241.1 hypothetical protein [Alphaproteobacteria bacterium]